MIVERQTINQHNKNYVNRKIGGVFPFPLKFGYWRGLHETRQAQAGKGLHLPCSAIGTVCLFASEEDLLSAHEDQETSKQPAQERIGDVLGKYRACCSGAESGQHCGPYCLPDDLPVFRVKHEGKHGGRQKVEQIDPLRLCLLHG